jgi:hypothetical protein
MAQSKLAGSAAGGALAGAQIGSVVPGVGTAIGAGIGALGGLAVGAFQKEDDVIKAKRMQARIDKLRGKGKDKKAKKVQKKMLAKTGAQGQLYSDLAAKARQKVAPGRQSTVIQSGSDVRAGQGQMAGTVAGPDFEAQGQRDLEQQALVEGMASAYQEQEGAGIIAEKEQSGMQLAGLEDQAVQERKAHDQQAMQTGMAVGKIAADGIKYEQGRQAFEGANPQPQMKVRQRVRMDETTGLPALGADGKPMLERIGKTVARPGEADYGKNKRGQYIVPARPTEEFYTTNGALMTMEMQNTAWEAARERAEWQQQTDRAVGDFYKFMAGYRENPYFMGNMGTLGQTGTTGQGGPDGQG